MRCFCFGGRAVRRLNRAGLAVTWIAAVVLGCFSISLAAGGEPEKARDKAALKPVSAEARRIHDAGMLFDGHNDLPWKLRMDGDMSFKVIDISTRLKTGHTDIPRLRAGGLKAQFWSVFIPSEFEHPARTVLEQIDLVRRMVARYPGDFELATTADEVEGAVRRGKIASLIGIEGGVAIENDLSMIRIYRDLGVSYMTLTHGKSLDWADSATDDPKCDGLSRFGERVVKEMNRVGMLVDVKPSIADIALPIERKLFRGKITFVDPEVQVAGEKKRRVFIDVDNNEERELQPGMEADLKIYIDPESAPPPPADMIKRVAETGPAVNSRPPSNEPQSRSVNR